MCPWRIPILRMGRVKITFCKFPRESYLNKKFSFKQHSSIFEQTAQRGKFHRSLKKFHFYTSIECTLSYFMYFSMLNSNLIFTFHFYNLFIQEIYCQFTTNCCVYYETKASFWIGVNHLIRLIFCMLVLKIVFYQFWEGEGPIWRKNLHSRRAFDSIWKKSWV